MIIILIYQYPSKFKSSHFVLSYVLRQLHENSFLRIHFVIKGGNNCTKIFYTQKIFLMNVIVEFKICFLLPILFYGFFFSIISSNLNLLKNCKYIVVIRDRARGRSKQMTINNNYSYKIFHT